MKTRFLQSGFLVMLLLLGWGSVKAQSFIVTGRYVGDDSDNRRITGIGFQPDVVIIKGDCSREGIIRVGTMSGDLSKKMAPGTHVSNRIQAILSDGFEVGTDDDVNKLGVNYYYTCIKNQPGKFTTGTYVGDGTHNNPVTGVGFTPDLVVTMNGADDEIILKTVDMPTASSCDIGNSCTTDRIISLDTDGFTVKNNPDVNASGKTYYYFAAKQASGAILVGSYTGDATSNRDITDVQFSPQLLFVKNASTDDAIFRTSTLSGDASLAITGNPNQTNNIKAFTSTGFTLGSNAKVNKAATTNYYFAFNDPGIPLSVNWLDFQVSRNANGMVNANWLVTHPKDALAFTLERSTDNVTFTEVASLPALSTNENQIQYTLDDENAPAMITWYRVKETGVDGSSNYSQTEAVMALDVPGEAMHLTLYPNPAHNRKFNVLINRAPTENTEIRIYDATGKLILFQTWTGQTSSNNMEIEFPEGLVKGSYFVEVTDQNFRTTEKIVVE